MSHSDAEPQYNPATGQPAPPTNAPPAPPNPGYAPPAPYGGYPQPPAGQPQYPTAPPGQYPSAPSAPPARPRSDAVPQPTPFTAYSGYQPAQLEPQQPRDPRPVYLPPSMRRKSSAVGLIGFLMAVAANIVAAASFMPAMPLMRKYFQQAQAGISVDRAQLTAELYTSGGINWAINIASWSGIAAFIIGIVAAFSGRGRGWGVGAILVCIVGPIAVIFFLVSVMVA